MNNIINKTTFFRNVEDLYGSLYGRLSLRHDPFYYILLKFLEAPTLHFPTRLPHTFLTNVAILRAYNTILIAWQMMGVMICSNESDRGEKINWAKGLLREKRTGV